jgi:hypothetical protein
MLNSSGGFSTPTTVHSSASSDKTPSFSPPPRTSSSSQGPSSNSVFLVGDEEPGSPLTRATSSYHHRPHSLSESPSSPLFQTRPYSSSINTPHRPPSNSSSSSSSQQHSPAIIRTAPLYISVYSSTPPIPLVKGTVSSSTPPIPPNDDELFFKRRSPSPQSQSILRKNEQLNSTIKHLITTSMQNAPNVNLPQPSVTRYSTRASPEEQQKRS